MNTKIPWLSRACHAFTACIFRHVFHDDDCFGWEHEWIRKKHEKFCTSMILTREFCFTVCVRCLLYPTDQQPTSDPVCGEREEPHTGGGRTTSVWPATNQQSRVWGKGGTTHGRRTNHQRLTSNQPAISRVPVACLPRDGRRTVCSVRYLSWRQFFFYENVEEQQGRIRTRVFSYSKNKEEEKGQ